MADKAKEKPAEAKATAPAKKRGGKMGFLMLIILFGCMVPFVMPTLILVLVGMIPTLVALIVDGDRNKSSAFAIGAMNCAGITPFIIDLWIKGQTMDNTFIILRQSSTWLIMLGAAAIGQLIIFAVPPAMASLTLTRAETRLRALKQNLEQLKTTWGPDVATTKPLDKMRQS